MQWQSNKTQSAIRRWFMKAKTDTEMFRDDEDGVMIIFGLVLFVLIFMFAGMAVDLMMMENTRVKVQQTVDRAVLAAADMQQTQDPEAVVREYFDTAGLTHYLVDVIVTDAINSRTVEAITSATVATGFLHMVGINSLTAPGTGIAREQVSDIEISLVVDISGSMGSNNRLKNLKTASKQFFNAVVGTQTTGGVTSVSIIPYNATVNAGATLTQHLNVLDTHDKSECIRFVDDEFNTIAISETTRLERVAHYNDGTKSYKKPTTGSAQCDTDPDHEILVHETNIGKMEDMIDDLSAGGWTGIDNGMKWAAALLDPAIRSVVNDLVANDGHSSLITDRPAEYIDSETMKVIVLMTDGDNTQQHDLKDQFKFSDQARTVIAMSDIYYSARWGRKDEDDGWLVYQAFADYDRRWYRPKNPNRSRKEDRFYAENDVPNDIVRQSYQDIFSEFWTEDAATYFYRYSDPDGRWKRKKHKSWSWDGDLPAIYWDMKNAVEMHDGYGEVDDRLEDICDAVRLKNVLVFTIGFEAPSGGRAAMKYCATTLGHYYDAKGTNISSVFASIASQINHLRLVK